MSTEHSLSDRALAMLDSMWATDTHMLVMRRRLHTLTGINYTPEEVRDAATRYQAPAVVEPARPAWRLERELPGRELPGREVEKVRLVKPKSFPSPVGGFSMLRRK